jgi:uncharacterized protein YkwD
VRSRTWISVLALVALLGAIGVATPAAAQKLLASKSRCDGQARLKGAPRKAERTVRCLINFARARHGVQALRSSGKLGRSANRKAANILRCQDYDHYACGRDVWDQIRATGYLNGCSGAGENLYWDSGRYGTPRFAVRQWLASPPHRRAMLRGRYDDVGIGLRRGTMAGESGAQVWVAHFGYRC